MSANFDAVFDAAADFAPDDPLAPVHAFVARARDEYGRLPAPAPRADLAVLFRDQPQRAALITLAPRPSTLMSKGRARTRRVRRVLIMAAALAVAVVSTGGLAVAGGLPAGMQKTISDVLDRVGVDVPHGPDTTTPPAPSSIAVDDTPGSPTGAHTGTATSTPEPASTPMSTEPVAAANPSAPGASTTTAPDLPEPPVAPVVIVPPATDVPLPTPPVLPAVPIDPPVDAPALGLPPVPITPSAVVPPLPVDAPIIASVDVPPLPVDAHGPARPDLPWAAVAHRKGKP